MLFDGQEINKISSENKQKNGDQRPKIPIGAQKLTVTSISLKTDNGVSKLVFEYKKDDGHRPSKEVLKLNGDYSDIDRSKVIDWFERAFGYLIQPCNTGEDLVRQLKQFEGKDFQGAIRHEKSLYTAQNSGEVMIVRYVRLWYVGNINDAQFKMDPSKGVKELSTKDMDRVTQLKNMGTIVRDVDDPEENANTNQNTVSSNTGDIVTSNGDDADPFA